MKYNLFWSDTIETGGVMVEVIKELFLNQSEQLLLECTHTRNSVKIVRLSNAMRHDSIGVLRFRLEFHQLLDLQAWLELVVVLCV